MNVVKPDQQVGCICNSSRWDLVGDGYIYCVECKRVFDLKKPEDSGGKG